MQNITIEMIKSRIEVLTARPKDNERIIKKLIRKVNRLEKEGR